MVFEFTKLLRSRFSLFLFFVSLFVLFCSSFVFAGDVVEIHDDWHPYHDFFSIGDDYYEVTNIIVDGSKETILKTLLYKNQAQYIISTPLSVDNDSQLFVTEENCKTDGYFSFCINSISLDPEKGGRADETGRYHYGTRIRIDEEDVPKADISIDKTLDVSSVNLGGKIKVSMMITNNGDKKATDVKIVESVGDGLVLDSFYGFDSRYGNTISKNLLEIFPEDEVSLSYSVFADDYVNSSDLVTNISYLGPLEDSLIESSSVSVIWPYSFSFGVSPAEVKIGEDSVLSFHISNKELVPLTFTSSSLISPYVDISGCDDEISISGRKLYISEIIDPEESEVFSCDLSSRVTGDYNVSSSASFSVNDEKFFWSGDSSFSVESDRITPHIYLSKSRMRSGDPLIVTLYLSNEDDDDSFVNINGLLSTGFSDDSFSLSSISPGKKSENVLFKTYYPPSVVNKTNFLFNVSGTFITAAGETFDFSTQKNLLVVPENMSVLFTQDVDKKEVSRGEEITVSVSAENVADKGSSTIRVSDSFSDGLEQTFGDLSADATIYGAENLNLYVYRLKVPYGFSKDNFTLTSTLFVEGRRMYSESQLISVLDAVDEYIPSVSGDETSNVSDDGFVDIGVDNSSSDNLSVDDLDVGTNNGSDDLSNGLNASSGDSISDNNNVEIEFDDRGAFEKFIDAIATFFANFFS